MDIENARIAIRDCVEGSEAGSMTFPEVVARLSAAGIERYAVDFCRSERIFYLPDGSSEAIAASPQAGAAASAFSTAAVDAAVRAVQAGRMNYRDFCERIMAGGCVGYQVSLTGRRTVYYGRTGETHVEPFPTGA